MLLLKRTNGLVIEVIDDFHKICADVVLLHGCPQSCMQNPVEGLLEVFEDMVEVLLILPMGSTSRGGDVTACRLLFILFWRLFLSL